jgi:hypothetical protein
MGKEQFETKKEARISEIKEDVLSRELELLKRQEQDLLERLNKTREAMKAKEQKLAFQKGGTKLIKEELAEAETLKKHKEAIKRGAENL